MCDRSDWYEVVEMCRRLLLTGIVLLLIPPEAEAMRLLFAQVRRNSRGAWLKT